MAETLVLPLPLRAPAPPRPVTSNPSIIHRPSHTPSSPSPPRLFSPTSLLSTSRPTPTSSSRKPRLGPPLDPSRGGGQPWHLPSSISLPTRRALLALLADPDHASPRNLLSAIPATELGAVMNALASRGHHDLALVTLRAARDLHGERVLHHPRALPAAVRVLARSGCLSEASALLDAAPEPEAIAYTALVSAFSRAGRFRDAVAVFRRMLGSGVRPTLVTYNVVLHVYSKMSVPWKEVVALVDSMKKDGVALDRGTQVAELPEWILHLVFFTASSIAGRFAFELSYNSSDCR